MLTKQKESELSTDEFSVYLKTFQQSNSKNLPTILYIAQPKSMEEYDEFISNRIINIPAYGNSKTTAFSFYKSISMSIQDDH
ncbi:MAG: hypothetical protein AAFP82_02330 [Bacteroidota bacterium]